MPARRIFVAVFSSLCTPTNAGALSCRSMWDNEVWNEKVSLLLSLSLQLSHPHVTNLLNSELVHVFYDVCSRCMPAFGVGVQPIV